MIFQTVLLMTNMSHLQKINCSNDTKISQIAEKQMHLQMCVLLCVSGRAYNNMHLFQ